jgi:hypothetical protein
MALVAWYSVDGWDVLVIVGGASVVRGLYLWAEPLAWVAAGVMFGVTGLRGSRWASSRR